MYRVTLPAVVMLAMTTWAPELAAGEPQRARARGGGDGGGRVASAPRSAPRAARPPARRAPAARAGRPAPSRPAARAPARRAPAPRAGRPTPSRPAVRAVPQRAPAPRAGRPTPSRPAARAVPQREPAARAGRPAPARPGVRAVPRRSPAAAGAGGGAPPRTGAVRTRDGRRPQSPRPGVASGRGPGRAPGNVRTGAARRPPDDVGVFGRAVPRPGRGRAGAPGRGGDDLRVGADRFRPGPYRQARPRDGRGYRGGYHRHVHRPRFFYPRVYGSYFYFPGYAFDLHYGYPYYWGPRWGGYSYWPYSPPYYLGYEDPYTGYLRLKVKPREAEVYVDGYYVGLVDHFDGVFQRLRLQEGGYRVEIRHPDFRSLELEVLIVAGSKVTYEARLEPQ